MTTQTLPSEDQLKGSLLRFVQSQKKIERFRVLPGNEEEFRLAIGMVTRVRRCVEAYFRLAKVGYSAEAEMLVRAAVEHAVTAQWAYLVVGGLEELRNSTDKSQVDILKALFEGTSDPEVKSRYDIAVAELPSGPFLPGFSRKDGILDQLDASFLNLSYRVLSQRLHITSKTMTDAFSVTSDGESLVVVDEPEGENHYEALTCLASSALLISWILYRLLGDDSEIERLRSNSHNLSLPYRLDLRLPAEKRRFPLETE